MASSMEEMREPEVTSIVVGNDLACPVNELPKVKETILQVIVSQISGTVQGIGSGIAWVVVLVEEKLICPIREKWTVAGSREGGDLEDGGSGGGLANLQDGEGTQEGMTPDQESTDQGGSVGFMLLDDFTDTARAATYLKDPKTYLTCLLIYELNSSIETLKEGFDKPTRAKNTLWYLLFGNLGTLFVLFTVLALAPRGSSKARILVKSMTAAGVLLFGLNLTLLYLKYQPGS